MIFSKHTYVLPAMSFLFGASLLSILLFFCFKVSVSNTDLAQASDDTNSPVGPWFVVAQGAPFPTHVVTFHSDYTMDIDNPEAGDHHTSDSVGIGPWAYDSHDHHTIKGKFVEINADRTTNQYVSKLIVTYTLTIHGNTFNGPAKATYYNPDGTYNAGPFDATLSGTRITLP